MTTATNQMQRKPPQLVDKKRLAEWLLENDVLSGNQFKVAFALLFSFHNSQDGRLFPGYEKLAHKAGVTKRTAIRTMRVLEDVGAITLIDRYGKPYNDGERNKGGWSERNRYILHHVDELISQHQNGDTSAPFEGINGDTSAPLTVTPAHPYSDTSAPLTVTPAHPHISVKGNNEGINEGISEGEPQVANAKSASADPRQVQPAGEYLPAEVNSSAGDKHGGANQPPVGMKSGGAKGARRAKGTRLSEDWEPSERDIEYARQLGMPNPMIQRDALKFKNHWLGTPGTKGEKLDWHRTWQTWCIRSMEYAATNQNARAQNGSAMTATLLQRAEADRNNFHRGGTDV
jgi:hypothetical protein